MLPTFETDRLILRPRTLADFDACLAMDRDPEVVRFIDGPWDDLEEHRRFLRARITQPFGPGLGYWSLFAKPRPDAFLGWILLIPNAGVGPEIEIGWRLNRSAWGYGYATEAARPVAAHALGAVGLDHIVAAIDAENSRSIRVAEKLSMRLHDKDGTYRGHPCRYYRMDRTCGATPVRR